ncbi:MAG: hypothetical protein HFI30_00225 [Lachnospiraceae bacterium]|jgi:hypothetical protein|nr:hypothetical protein [Lachnospiraceae bacterium]
MQRKKGVKRNMLLAFGGALVLAALYFLWAYQTFPFIYDINDDVAMRNVAAGVITGSPDAHLIHMKYVLGLLISGLYWAVSGFDWYGIVMTGMICFSLVILLYRVFVTRRRMGWKLAWGVGILLAFTLLGLQHLIFFQWTVAAGMMGGAGLFLFVSSCPEDAFQAWVEEGVSVFCILLTLCIRDDVFLLVLPLAALLFWNRYGRLIGRKPYFRLKHWQTLAALTAGVICILGVEAFVYRSPEWKEFLAYNKDREAIMDFYGIPGYDEDREFFDSMGMSEETVVNLHRYSLYLVDDLYSQRMHALAENARDLYVKEYSPIKRLTMGMEKVCKNLLDVKILPTTAAALALGGILWVFLQRKRQLGLLAVLQLLFGAYWLYTGYRGRVVDRVVYTMLLLQIFTSFGLLLCAWDTEGWDEWYSRGTSVGERGAGGLWKSVKENWQNFCMFLLTACCLAILCGYQVKELERRSTERRDYNQQFLQINAYMAEHMEYVYFMTTFSIETYTDNFTLRRDFSFTNLLSVGGWHSFSELENKKIAKLGLGGQTMENAMLTGENVYVISLARVNMDYMDRYFTAKYGNAYKGRKLVDTQTYADNSFEVYKFTLSESENEGSTEEERGGKT